MTLKVVVDNTVELPVYNFKNIAACAERFAQQLETGEHGEPIRVVVVAHTAEGLGITIWGEHTSAYELVGLFEAAKLRVFDDDIDED